MQGKWKGEESGVMAYVGPYTSHKSRSSPSFSLENVRCISQLTMPFRKSFDN